jgi:hypothetical protein
MPVSTVTTAGDLDELQAGDAVRQPSSFKHVRND